MTLSYCFFSFYRVAPHSVAPTTWPSAWLVFVCVFFLNPVRTCHGRARWWFVRVVANVLTPGLASITFIFFFLADILASHTYTIQNIYLLGCVAAHKWPDDAFAVCKTSDWTFALLGSLASIARLLQCLKRFWDTRLWIHLFNALKYSIGIITVCLGVWTSSRGFTHDALSLSLYIIFAVINSGFACAWVGVIESRADIRTLSSTGRSYAPGTSVCGPT
jgi:hypothetical protein